MEGPSAPASKKERIVDWHIVGRRAKRPAPWIAIVVLAAVTFLLLEAYVWQPARYAAPAEEPFRFDSVYMLERGSEGNFSTFAVSPWFSNPGRSTTRDVEFVIYAVESSRRIATSVASVEIGDLAPMRTQNASIELRLNNTRDYSIEILVLQGDYLIARGYGSVGWIHYYSVLDHEGTDASAIRMAIQAEPDLRSGDFVYEYPGR